MHEIVNQFKKDLIKLLFFTACLISFIHSQNQMYYKQYADTSAIKQDGRIIQGINVVVDGRTLVIGVKEANGNEMLVQYSMHSGIAVFQQSYHNTDPPIYFNSEKTEVYQNKMVGYSPQHSTILICQIGSTTVNFSRNTLHKYKKIQYSYDGNTTAFLSPLGKIGYFNKNLKFPFILKPDFNMTTIDSIQNVSDIQMSRKSELMAAIDKTNSFTLFQTQNYTQYYKSPNSVQYSVNRLQFISWNVVTDQPWSQLYHYKADENILNIGNFEFSNNPLNAVISIQPYDKSKYEPQQMKFLPSGVGHNDLLIFASRQIEGDNKNVFFHFFDLSQNSTFTTKKQFASEVKGVQFFRNDPSKMAIFTDTQVAYYDIQFCNTDNNATEYFSSTLLTCVTCTPACQNCSEAGCAASIQEPVINNTDQGQPQENSETEIEQDLQENIEESDPGKTQIQIQIAQFQDLLNNVVKNNFTESINLIPGGRRIFSIFYSMFTNFDDLWLYSYHQKQYNAALKRLFEIIQEFQNEKWELVPYVKLWNIVGINMKNVKAVFQLKGQYTSQKFKDVQNDSNGFIPNTMNYLFSSLFFTFITFILLKLLFFLIFNYKVSILIRQYSFWPTLILMALDGNIQYFSYLLAFEVLTLFSKTFMYKLLYVLILCCLFMLVIGLTILFIQVKRIYKKLSKYFFDNVSTKKIAIMYMTVNFGIRSFIFGISHYLFEGNYQVKIIWLTFLQFGFTFFNIFLLRIDTYSIQETRGPLKKRKISFSYIFASKLKVFFAGTICSILRIIFNLTLIVQNDFDKSSKQNQVVSLFTQAHILLIYAYIFTSLLQVINSTIISIKELYLSIFGIQNSNLTLRQQNRYFEIIDSAQYYKKTRTKQERIKRKAALQNLLTRLKAKANKENFYQKFNQYKRKNRQNPQASITNIKTCRFTATLSSAQTQPQNSCFIDAKSINNVQSNFQKTFNENLKINRTLFTTKKERRIKEKTVKPDFMKLIKAKS